MKTLRTVLTGAALVSVLAVGNVALSGGDGSPSAAAVAAERTPAADAEVRGRDPDLKAIEEFFSRDEGADEPSTAVRTGGAPIDSRPRASAEPQERPAPSPSAAPRPAPTTPATAADTRRPAPAAAQASPAAMPPTTPREPEVAPQVAATGGSQIYDLSPEEVRTLQDFLGNRISQDGQGRLLLDDKPADLGQLMAAVQMEHERQLNSHVSQLTTRHKRLAEISRTLDRLKKETTQLFAENQQDESSFQSQMAKRQKALEVLSGVVTKDLKKLDALLSSVN